MKPWPATRVLAAVVATGIAAVAITMSVTTRTAATAEATPSPVDIGFARDMSIHHTQAVEMAQIVLARTDTEAVTVLARDILMTQQAQIGMMYGWLDLWGRPKTTTGPRMAWMTGSGTTGAMPGMATPADLTDLEQRTGPAADQRFLELMIAHHQAGVDMAAAAAVQARVPAVRQLAEVMATGQQAEIATMQELVDAETN